MKKNFEEHSVLSLRKKLVAQTIVSVLIVAGIGIAGLMTSTETPREEFDLNRFLEGLDLPQRAPYLASDGVFAGEANGDDFGYTVASAGDFDNDGKDDVVVGAPDAGYSDRGKVYIFFGGDVDPSTPDVTITTIAGDTDNEDFGWSVAGGGDFDGSPGHEVIVGDPRYDNGDDTDAGIIYIFTYDSETSAMALSDAIYDDLVGEGAYNLLGSSVDIAGDFNNRDYDDAIIGAPGYDSDRGRAYIVLGKLSPETYSFIAEDSQPDARFGESVSYAGDLDNDDDDEVIIGAPNYDDNGDIKGGAYLFKGFFISGDLEAGDDSFEIIGGADGDKFGFSVSSAGDIDGDGDDDLIVGAPWYSGGKGRAYIFTGDITGDEPSAFKTLTGGAFGDEFGISVSSAGDYNDDGYDDVIVGAYREDTIGADGTDAGKVHIFYGGSSMDENVDITMVGDTSSSNRYRLGRSVSDAGDYDNDGYDDVIVGAPEASSGKGYAHLYHFHDHFSTTGDPSSYISEMRGFSVASGNINGDSYDDIIVGAPWYSPNPMDKIFKGKVYVFEGSSTGIVSSPLLMELSEGNRDDYFGYSVASGNFNGDMFDDVIVGAPGHATSHGRAYIFYGGFDPNNGVDITLTGENNYDQFGYSVAAAETHTSPMISYDDAIVGAPGYSSSTGRIYVFNGGRSMDTTADYTKDGESSGDWFGRSVSNAGDVNGAAEDVIVGAPYVDIGAQANVGKAYVYTGSLIGLWGPPIATLSGENAGDEFGLSVSGAGNFNGDSYDDVIVGAHNYGNGDGKAYIYYGDSTPFDSGPTFTGEGDGGLGYAVSSAGDVNNDGYDDVVIGEPNNDAGGNTAGRVYILYGDDSTGDGREDVYMTGQSVNELLGSSVAAAGDVNNDNYDDVVIGAIGASSAKGRVTVWGDPS